MTADITDRKMAEERQALLAREVDHRAKNALALVQAIVRMTKANSIEAYVTAVEGRIKALSRVHTVLSQSRWEGADLNRLVVHVNSRHSRFQRIPEELTTETQRHREDRKQGLKTTSLVFSVPLCLCG